MHNPTEQPPPRQTDPVHISVVLAELMAKIDERMTAEAKKGAA